MKKSGILVAAASATAATSYSSFPPNSKIHFSRQESVPSNRDNDNSSSSSTQNANTSEKFAPRFDGLRFIETLVTAHR